MANDEIKTYWSKEIAKLLDISTSTLRKWSIALESEGYIFIRDKNDRRVYLERDIMTLHKMKELLDDGFNMNDAAKAVTLRFQEQIVESRTHSVIYENERSLQRYFEYLELIMNELQDLKNENKRIRQILEKKKWWKFW